GHVAIGLRKIVANIGWSLRQITEWEPLGLHPRHITPAGGVLEESVATGQFGREVRDGAGAAIVVFGHKYGTLPTLQVRGSLQFLLGCTAVSMQQNHINGLEEGLGIVHAAITRRAD